MNKTPSFFSKLRYRFDNFISANTWRTVAWLGFAIFLFFFATSISVAIINLFHSNTETLSPLIISEQVLLSIFHPRILSLVLIFIFLFIISLFIALVNMGVQDRMMELRRGRTKVWEKNHIVILGWSDKIFNIVHELSLVEPKKGKICIAILADKDKMEMRYALEEKVGNIGSTKVICRSGNPVSVYDVNIVNPQQARTIIILPNENKDSDISVLKTLMAIINNPIQKETPYNIITEINDPSNIRVAHIVAQDQVTILNTKEITARITVQTARQAGLSNVYAELMDFRGVEVYFQRERKLWGKTFQDAVFAYNHSTVIGIRKKSSGIVSSLDPEPYLRAHERDIIINPPHDYLIEEGDSVIVISEDSSSIKVTENILANIDASQIIPPSPPILKAERTLVLGWNRNAHFLIRELDSYVSKGSEVLILSVCDLSQEYIDKMNQELLNLKFLFKQCDATQREVLEYEKPNNFDHVIVLSNTDDFSIEEADSRCLIGLVHLRDLAEERQAHFNLVSELADSRNIPLAQKAAPDDFIISSNIAGLLIAQITENKELKMVFEEFFDAEGKEITLQPASDYIALDQAVNFFTITESALRRNEIAIGYRLFSEMHNPQKNHGIVLNPVKNQTQVFAEKDSIIVIKG